MPPLFLLAAI